mmetsp:Transcript_8497/g.23638  ORF Transcript_8497/g.23638 Transcript_8497/m.23638 type:complete len:203 (+) Transcript_8497:738-1346(+)
MYPSRHFRYSSYVPSSFRRSVKSGSPMSTPRFKGTLALSRTPSSGVKVEVSWLPASTTAHDSTSPASCNNAARLWHTVPVRTSEATLSSSIFDTGCNCASALPRAVAETRKSFSSFATTLGGGAVPPATACVAAASAAAKDDTSREAAPVCPPRRGATLRPSPWASASRASKERRNRTMPRADARNRQPLGLMFCPSSRCSA